MYTSSEKKALISCAVTARLIYIFVFANADCLFSHDAAHFTKQFGSGSEVIKLFSCSTQQRLKFILLINVKMPTIGILTI